MAALADRADERGTGMDPHAKGDAQAARGPLIGGAQEGLAGLDRARGVSIMGDRRDEDCHHLVAHELVDDRIVIDEDLRGLR